MTAAKTPPERVTLYLDDYGHVWTEDEGGSQGVDPAFDYVRADLAEKRERALRLLLEQALDSLESAIGWPGIVAADDAVRTVDAIRDELVLEPNALAAADEGEKSR